MVGTAEPSHVERARIVIVVLLGSTLATGDLARLRHELPAALVDLGVGSSDCPATSFGRERLMRTAVLLSPSSHVGGVASEAVALPPLALLPAFRALFHREPTPRVISSPFHVRSCTGTGARTEPTSPCRARASRFGTADRDSSTATRSAGADRGSARGARLP